uniref:Dihydrolipoyl dehydrogenase n=1 Tax=Polytomella parva TaxID=51329 RepID=A0A7S0VC90_9CHLO|mmetsp:Transcript_34999/g.62932  ORF Transcript_34999/g.62932 Transcript_34999/m.62932 type:complete len:731 (+) Transcript_34999:104-2296(+)
MDSLLSNNVAARTCVVIRKNTSMISSFSVSEKKFIKKSCRSSRCLDLPSVFPCATTRPISLFRSSHSASHPLTVRAQASSPSSRKDDFDYDLIIVGAGVGGHGAALHAAEKGLRVCVVEAGVIGGTCVNRGCVPSKALLAAAGRLHALKDTAALAKMGIHANGFMDSIQIHSGDGVTEGSVNSQGGVGNGGVVVKVAEVAAHAQNLASTIRENLRRTLQTKGVAVVQGHARILPTGQAVSLAPPGRVDGEGARIVTARDIILAPGSDPVVPPGMVIDGETVFTSDTALRLPWIPPRLAIVGSGYIGLELADVYGALGSKITVIESAPTLMPSMDKSIQRLAQRLLIQKRGVEALTGVAVTRIHNGVKGLRPATLELCAVSTSAVPGVALPSLQVDAVLVAAGRRPRTECLGLAAAGIQRDARGAVPVDEHFRVLRRAPKGDVVPHLYCIGDANGVCMLAHAASAQGIAAVETLMGRPQQVPVQSVPAACFTHPEIAFIGLTQQRAMSLFPDASTPLSNAVGSAAAATAAAATATPSPSSSSSSTPAPSPPTPSPPTPSPTSSSPPTAAPSVQKTKSKVGVVTVSYKGNTKALAEAGAEGLAVLVFRRDTGEILGAHVMGERAADLVHAPAAAFAAAAAALVKGDESASSSSGGVCVAGREKGEKEGGKSQNKIKHKTNEFEGPKVQHLRFAIHAHPTLSEVWDELYKAAAAEVDEFQRADRTIESAVAAA